MALIITANTATAVDATANTAGAGAGAADDDDDDDRADDGIIDPKNRILLIKL